VSVLDRFVPSFDASRHRRTIAGTEVVLHCHHYNARLQRTIERAKAIDGKSIWVSSSEGVFARMLADVIRPDDDDATRREVVEALYAHLGYGTLDFAHIDDACVLAPHSHFVEGRLASLSIPSRPLCSLTTGYIQASVHAMTGETVRVHEVDCRALGAPACRFEIARDRSTPLYTYARAQVPPGTALAPLVHSNVDEAQVVRALAELPVGGGREGLMPAFNVYVASTPADLYNLVTIRFLDEMRRVGLETAARAQLVNDAEDCGRNTFRGIMASAEWQSHVEPMIRDDRDRVFGAVAVSNALGWGRWTLLEQSHADSMVIASSCGYEADGQLGLRGPAASPACLTLRGVSAGLMSLVYGHGALNDRSGQYCSTEEYCRCTRAGACTFVVEEAA
jgi:hypothetical protein